MAKDNFDLDLKAVTEAVDEVKTSFEAFKDAAEEREKELLTKGDVDPLLEEKLKKINESISDHQGSIDKLYAAGRRKNYTLDGKSISPEELDKKAAQWAATNFQRRGMAFDGNYTHEDAQAYKSAFRTLLTKGENGLSDDERKALQVGVDPDGGWTVDPDTTGRTVQLVRETSPLRQYASVAAISGNEYEGLYDLDDVGYGWVGETGDRTETSTPQFKRWRIEAHEMYAMPAATQRMLDDANFGVEEWLARKTASRFTRAENTAFVSGTGVDQPRGFLTYPAGTTNPGQIAQLATGVNGGFAATPDGADKLISMIHKLKAPYRANGVFAMNRTTMEGVRLLKDSNGRMLWQPSIAAGQPSTLLSYPVASFEDMPDYTTTDALAIAFADWSEFYQIVDRLGTRMIRDNVTQKPYTLFYQWRRVGGAVVNFEAGTFLKFGS